MTESRQKKRKLESSDTVPDSNEFEPIVPCLEVVLSYLPFVELGDLAGDVKSPCLAWEEWKSAFRAEHLWKKASKACFESYSFFKDCKHYVQDSIPLSQAQGMAETSYCDFFLKRIYPILKYLQLFEETYKETTGTEWTRDLDSGLCLNGHFIVSKDRSLVSRSYIGTSAAFVSEQTFQDLKDEFKKNTMNVGQIDCSLFNGSLTSGGLLPRSGMLYFMLQSPNMDSNGGSIIYSTDLSDLKKKIFVSNEENCLYPKRNITGIREVLTPTHDSSIDWDVNSKVEKLAKNKLGYNHSLDYFFGYKSTSQQGYNQVEAGQFLLLQANIYGEQYMDGIENYFILPKEQLKKEPKDFKLDAGGNFSLYANC